MDRLAAGGDARRPPAVRGVVRVPATETQVSAPKSNGLPQEVTGFVKNGVVHLVEGELPEGTFVRILPARR